MLHIRVNNIYRDLALTFRFFFKYPLILTCDEGVGVADLAGCFVVTSDVQTATESDEFGFVAVNAVDAFCGNVFSSADNVGFATNGWLDDDANGALLLFFTTNFCISFVFHTFFSFFNSTVFMNMPFNGLIHLFRCCSLQSFTFLFILFIHSPNRSVSIRFVYGKFFALFRNV